MRQCARAARRTGLSAQLASEHLEPAGKQYTAGTSLTVAARLAHEKA